MAPRLGRLRLHLWACAQPVRRAAQELFQLLQLQALVLGRRCHHGRTAVPLLLQLVSPGSLLVRFQPLPRAQRAAAWRLLPLRQALLPAVLLQAHSLQRIRSLQLVHLPSLEQIRLLQQVRLPRLQKMRSLPQVRSPCQVRLPRLHQIRLQQLPVARSLQRLRPLRLQQARSLQRVRPSRPHSRRPT